MSRPIRPPGCRRRADAGDEERARGGRAAGARGVLDPDARVGLEDVVEVRAVEVVDAGDDAADLDRRAVARGVARRASGSRDRRDAAAGVAPAARRCRSRRTSGRRLRPVKSASCRRCPACRRPCGRSVVAVAAGSGRPAPSRKAAGAGQRLRPNASIDDVAAALGGAGRRRVGDPGRVGGRRRAGARAAPVRRTRTTRRRAGSCPPARARARCASRSLLEPHSSSRRCRPAPGVVGSR